LSAKPLAALKQPGGRLTSRRFDSMTKLIAKQQFTDKSGVTRNVGDQFEINDHQEALQYIRNGQADADQASDRTEESQYKR
jgi:hypothetical protein